MGANLCGCNIENSEDKLEINYFNKEIKKVKSSNNPKNFYVEKLIVIQNICRRKQAYNKIKQIIFNLVNEFIHRARNRINPNQEFSNIIDKIFNKTSKKFFDKNFYTPKRSEKECNRQYSERKRLL